MGVGFTSPTQEQQRALRGGIHHPTPTRSSLGHHPRQSFEFDRGQQHDGPSQSTRQDGGNNNSRPHGSTSRAPSDAAASSPYSDHSSR